MYADTTKTPFEIIPRPNWYDTDGKPVMDDQLRTLGIYAVLDQPLTDYDPLIHLVTWNPTDQWVLDGDYVYRTRTVTSKALVDVKWNAATTVDSAAEATRNQLLTPGSGQALEYDATRIEAERWQADPAPDINSYPMLRAEWRALLISDPNSTAQQAVDDALHNAQIWTTVGAAIKEIRRSAKVAIDMAETVERVRDVFNWAHNALQQAAANGTFDPLPQDAPAS